MTPARYEFDLDEDTAIRAGMAYQPLDPAALAMMRAGRARVTRLLAAWFAVSLTGLAAAGWDALGLGVFGGLMLAILAAAYATFPGRVRRANLAYLRRLYRHPTGAAALGRRTVELTADKLVVRTRYSREEYGWGAVLWVRQTPDFLFLVLPGPRPVAIPFAAFRDAAEFEKVADELRTAVGETV